MEDFDIYDERFEFIKLIFPETNEGQEEKIKTVRGYVSDGWTVVSERSVATENQPNAMGKLGEGDAVCCTSLFTSLICLPALCFAPCGYITGPIEREAVVILKRQK